MSRRFRLPLELRLPNPPPIFVGRDHDVARAATSLRRAPVTIARGSSGIGKAALLSHVIHRQFRDDVDRTVVIAGSGHPVLAPHVVACLERVVEHRPQTTVPAQRALELAEAAKCWVLIDSAEDATWELIALAAQYARDSRWLVTTDLAPTAAVLEYVVPIAPLTEAALDELATAWDTEMAVDDRVLAVVGAHGSPSRLRRALADRVSRDTDTLSTLDPAARGVLDVLSVTTAALKSERIVALAPNASVATVRGLEELGLVVASPTGLTLATRIRPIIVRRASPLVRVQLARTLVDVLARDTDAFAIGEAIRLALELGEFAVARSLLDRDGERVFASSEALAIARALIGVTEPELMRWRLRAVVELGDGDMLPDIVIDDQLAGQPGDRLLWAEALVRANRIDAALKLVAASDDPAARLLAARSLGTRGDFTAAHAELARIRTSRDVAPDVEIGAAALEARLHVLEGHNQQARAELARVSVRLGALSESGARAALQSLASAYHDLGDLTATEATLDDLDRRLDTDPFGRFVSRRLQLVRAIVAVERGKLTAASQLLGELDRGTGVASLHRPFIAVISASVALVRGELREAVAQLGGVDEAAIGSGYVGAWAAAVGTRVALVDPAAIAPSAGPTASGVWPACARLHAARLELRREAAPTISRADLALAVDGPIELWFAERALAWEQALLGGQAAKSLDLALEAAKRCDELGFVAFELEATAGAVDAALVARDARACAREIDRLEELARRVDSPRFTAEAAFSRMLASRSPLEGYESVALGPIGPCTRRARWILGAPQVADAIDRTVMTAVAPTQARLLGEATEPWRSGWGIDRRRRCVWRPDGSVASLAEKPQLWRLLDALVGSPLGISKEALLVEAWEVAYHPLRHDKLLHNSIHKLRKLIEEDLATPRRIPTTTDGYRLGSDEPIRIVERD